MSFRLIPGVKEHLTSLNLVKITLPDIIILFLKNNGTKPLQPFGGSQNLKASKGARL
jgi:hypothetical protein